MTIFQKIDANKDGKVTHEEIAAYFGNVFDAFDLNHDGKLGRTGWYGAASSEPVVELSTGVYARDLSSDSFMTMVKDDHKYVAREDFVSQHEKIFDAMRANKSGTLDSKRWLAGYFPH